MEKEIDTIASGDYTLDVDFSKNIAVTVDVPATLSESTAKGSVTIENLSSVSHDVELTLSADGVALDKADYSLTIGAGQSATQEFTLTAGYKVMPYAVLCAASVGGKETFAVGEGRVASTALRSQKSFTVSASSNGGGALSCEEQNTVLEGDGLTVSSPPTRARKSRTSWSTAFQRVPAALMFSRTYRKTTPCRSSSARATSPRRTLPTASKTCRGSKPATKR